MKAKIKATGEIIKIADYSTITLDKCDSWGNPVEIKPEDIELIQDVTEDEHWQDVKERAAIAAIQGILANSTLINDPVIKIEEISVNCANELVKQLKDELYGNTKENTNRWTNS